MENHARSKYYVVSVKNKCVDDRGGRYEQKDTCNGHLVGMRLLSGSRCMRSWWFFKQRIKRSFLYRKLEGIIYDLFSIFILCQRINCSGARSRIQRLRRSLYGCLR